MYPLNDLVTQYRQQEIEQAARHPSQLMAHDLRRARRCTRRRRAVTSPGGGLAVVTVAARALVVRPTHAAIVVLVAMTLLSGFVSLR